MIFHQKPLKRLQFKLKPHKIICALLKTTTRSLLCFMSTICLLSLVGKILMMLFCHLETDTLLSETVFGTALILGVTPVIWQVFYLQV